VLNLGVQPNNSGEVVDSNFDFDYILALEDHVLVLEDHVLVLEDRILAGSNFVGAGAVGYYNCSNCFVGGKGLGVVRNSAVGCILGLGAILGCILVGLLLRAVGNWAFLNPEAHLLIG